MNYMIYLHLSEIVKVKENSKLIKDMNSPL